MRISLDTLRRDVQSRLVSFFRATVIEGDVDALESFSALSFGLPGIGLAVSTGQFDIVGEGSQQGTRVEAIGRHHVGFGAQQQCRGDQIQEGQQAEHQSKHAVGGAVIEQVKGILLLVTIGLTLTPRSTC